MKKIIIGIMILSLPMLLQGQKLEEQILNEKWSTRNTISKRYGQWMRFATCEITSPWQDYGTTFEIMGNGSGNSLYYYGKLIARFKRQASTVGPITNYEMVLFNSNIGSENIKAVRNDTRIDIYIRVNNSYTSLYFRRILSGSSSITALQEGCCYADLPKGDLLINCVDAKLHASDIDVKGTINASEIRVTVAQTADFVFEPDYNLRPLNEVEAFVKQNKHLPEIPSAKQMKADGVNVAQMNKLLLQKVEELTLYVIETQKQVEKIKEELSEVKSDNLILKSNLNKYQ